MSNVLLNIQNLSVSYGHIEAVRGVTMEVRAGEIVTLIGSNGAGKSTTLRTISGLIKASSGSVTLEGRELLGVKAHQIARLGVAHAPEGRHVIPGLTVEQNLEIGSTSRGKEAREVIEADLAKIYSLFPRLDERRKQSGWSLSGGEQQMLTLGRALISKPKILILDEPSLGLAPMLTQEVFNAIRKINEEEGVSILLVEQNAFMALSVAHRCYLLENGTIRMSGTAAELQASEEVRNSYLGV